MIGVHLIGRELNTVKTMEQDIIVKNGLFTVNLLERETRVNVLTVNKPFLTIIYIYIYIFLKLINNA